MISKISKRMIILINFPMTNMSTGKIRPALVIAEHKEDVVLLMITSKENKKEEDMFLEITPSTKNGLRTISNIKINRIATIEKKLIFGMLGEIEEKYFKEVKSKLNKFLC